MEFLSKSKIIGLGAYLPQRRLTNHDLEQMVDTNDAWIVQRTGMRERRIVAEDEYASHLGIGAVENLVQRCGVQVDDVDLIIVTTFTPDHFTPTVSAQVQAHFGMPHAGTFDLGAGCTGFTYALWTADALITAGRSRKVLVIAAENVTRAVDYTDRASCILFGDAGVACLLERTEGKGSFLGGTFTTDGHLGHNVTCTNYSQNVNGHPVEKKGIFDQDGQVVYKYVVQQVPPGVRRLLEATGLTQEEIDWFVPHSANLRIIEAACAKLGFPLERTLTSLELHGNTSSATIPLALWLAAGEGRLQPGQKVLLYGFGGGLTHGGVVIEW